MSLNLSIHSLYTKVGICPPRLFMLREIFVNLDPSTRKNYLSTPYIKGASEKVEKLLKPFNLKLSNKSSNTLRTQLCKLKDKKKKRRIK